MYRKEAMLLLISPTLWPLNYENSRIALKLGIILRTKVKTRRAKFCKNKNCTQNGMFQGPPCGPNERTPTKTSRERPLVTGGEKWPGRLDPKKLLNFEYQLESILLHQFAFQPKTTFLKFKVQSKLSSWPCHIASLWRLSPLLAWSPFALLLDPTRSSRTSLALDQRRKNNMLVISLSALMALKQTLCSIGSLSLDQIPAPIVCAYYWSKSPKTTSYRISCFFPLLLNLKLALVF